MISKSKRALIVAITVIGVASPALAQSGDNGRDIYDLVPSSAAVSPGYDPATTGGGSAGYNENLITNQW
jgi:hypothetical protein